jgi:hypothetical protein
LPWIFAATRCGKADLDRSDLSYGRDSRAL